MSDQPKKEPEKIVTNQATKPCGCMITEYSDKSKVVNPCPPCGLMEAANQLGGVGQCVINAANALGAVANRLRQEQNRAVMSEVGRALGGG